MRSTRTRFSVAFVCSMLLAVFFSIPAFAAGETLGNEGYPYGSDMSTSGFTLNVVVDGADATTSYQWQSSEAQTGSYTDIPGAQSASCTVTSAVSGTWYRCVINGTLTTKTVQAAQVVSDNPEAGQIQVTKTFDGDGRWYISNGTMAYTSLANEGTTTNFDVIGKYTREGTTLWINTAFSRGWQLLSSSVAEPSSSSASIYTGSAQLDALLFAFDSTNPHTINVIADLAATEQAFAFGADVMLGVDRMFNDYEVADEASLKAIYKDGVVSQVQMVGAESISLALENDPAFVLKLEDEPSYYWLGGWDSRRAFAFNLDGEGNTIEEVSGMDSGMTASWMQVPAGGKVRFAFNVGTVLDTGADLEATSSSTSTTITVLDPDPDYYYSLYSADGTTLLKEWVCQTDASTPIEFTGLDPDTAYLIRAIAKSDYNGDSSKPQSGASAANAAATTAIDPMAPVTPGETVTVDTDPESITLQGLNPAYEYALEDASGNPIATWQTPDAQGNLTFAGLTPGTQYFLAAKSSSNSGSDRVPVSTARLPQDSTPDAGAGASGAPGSNAGGNLAATGDTRGVLGLLALGLLVGACAVIVVRRKVLQ